MEINFKRASFGGNRTVITKIGGVTHEQYLDYDEYNDFVFLLLGIAIGEIDYDTHSRFIESIRNEVGRAGYSIIHDSDIAEMEELRQEQENYIKQLEAQISRDRESLVKANKNE